MGSGRWSKISPNTRHIDAMLIPWYEIPLCSDCSRLNHFAGRVAHGLVERGHRVMLFGEFIFIPLHVSGNSLDVSWRLLIDVSPKQRYLMKGLHTYQLQAMMPYRFLQVFFRPLGSWLFRCSSRRAPGHATLFLCHLPCFGILGSLLDRYNIL